MWAQIIDDVKGRKGDSDVKMNAVERVRERYQKGELPYRTVSEISFDDGYYHALSDVQEELNEELSSDWEVEYLSLKKEIERLKVVYEAECELSSHHATTIMKQNEEIMLKDKKLNELKTKWEAVELIFGGK